MQLFHATTRANLASIAEGGMRRRSFWTSCPRMLAYYLETVEDEAAEPATVSISLKRLLTICRAQGVEPEPDMPGVDEPITTVLGVSADEVRQWWSQTDRTWVASLEVVRGLVCPVEIAAHELDGVPSQPARLVSARAANAPLADRPRIAASAC